MLVIGVIFYGIFLDEVLGYTYVVRCLRRVAMRSDIVTASSGTFFFKCTMCFITLKKILS